MSASGQRSLFDLDPGRDPIVESWSKVMARRMQSLVIGYPIFDMVSRGGSGHHPHWAKQNFTFLALQVFDAVFARMAPGSGRGATRDQIINDLEPYIKDADPDLSFEQIVELVDFVLNTLMNDGRGSFQEECVWVEESKHARPYTFKFALLKSYHDPDTDQFVIRASGELIHLYLRMLDQPVEDEQLANLFILQEQVRRGRIDRARHEAERTMLLSLEYERGIDDILRTVRRDVRGVDWVDDVTPKLEEAHQHVQRLIRDQGRVLSELKDELNRNEDAAKIRVIHELIALLDQCQRRHMVLEKRILSAGPTFLEEQSFQRFRSMARSPMPDLSQQVFHPALSLQVPFFRPMLRDLYRTALGPRIHRMLDLEVFIEKVLREDAIFEPREDDEAHDERMPVNPLFDPLHDEIEEKIARILVRISDRPIRLSKILEIARMDNMDSHEQNLLGVTILHSYHARSDLLGLTVSKDGQMLDDPEFIGDDLLIHRTPPEAADAPESNQGVSA